MTTDQTAADARARIAAALSPMTVVGGTPPQLLVPVIDGSKARMARIADWQPLDVLVDAVLAAVSVPPPPPARSATRGLSVPHRDALYDAVAPPGPGRPTFPEQHERVCRAVAEILDEVAPPVPAADRAAVLSEAAQRLYTALFPAVYADMGQKAAEGVNRAVSELRRMADEEQPECSASISGRCLRESQSETACDTDAGECVHGGRPTAEEQPATEAQAVRRARHEGAIDALRSAAEHMSLGAAVGPVPLEVRPVVEAWLCRLAEQRRERAAKEAVAEMRQPATERQQPAVAYSDGKGRVYCLACASKVAAEVLLTVEDVDHWELCPSCGRHVVDVARAEQQPAADGTDEEQRDA